jgi:hypothetical protein
MSTSQASVAERRARIEKLKKERDQKEADRKINEAREAQQKNEKSASNDLIRKILSESRGSDLSSAFSTSPVK